ncbi:MAG: hypothetical protein IKN71_07050 [Alphaproteobacteria bacterium]|nr:hypothetical protein [Alphaproteobacteria bacterium]
MKEKHTRFIWPVDEPFKIAYRDPLSGIMTLLPYIDLQWKMKIWGVSIGERVYKLNHEPGADWFKASAYVDKLCQGYMPTTDDLDEAFAYKEGFNEIIALLKSQRIAAEPWVDGWYWSTEDDGDKATVVDMSDGKAELIDKKIKNGYTRLVSRRIADKTPTVHYPLVYFDEGIFKISYDLILSRKNQLWGIQSGKNYFCLREEKPQTWYQAKTAAESVCDDKVRISLPKKEMFDELRREREAVNDALMKLQAFGIVTDLWKDKYWRYLTASEYLDHYVTCEHEMIPKDTINPCRFIGENRNHRTVLL